jgi:phage/plasmid-like protein (TIGR03299 family)
MAHMVETMAYAGEVPWHGLGTKVPADLTPMQMLEKAGLDWTVEKEDLFTASGQKVPGKKGLIRSDGKYLDTIGDDWNPLQNHEAAEFFNDFVAEGDMEMNTAGSLEDGRRMWMLAKIKDGFTLFGKDDVEQYLLFSNPHKYGLTITVQSTPIRVVCNNTIAMALGRASEHMVKVNHRQVFDPQLVKETLGVAKEKLELYKEAAEFLGSKRFTNESVVDYFKSVFPTTSAVKETEEGEVKLSRGAKASLEVLDTQPGAEFGRGTYWQAFNAVTYLTDHQLGQSSDTRLTSAWFGANRKKKINALDKAIEFAEAA